MEHDFGLYVIATRPTLSYGRVAEICVERGIRYLQLREKHLSDRELLAAAHQIRSATRGTQTRFVMNDRADLALLAEADALHLGQDDISIEQARKIVGDMPIGLSTHSIEQARQALKHSPAYIGFGPIYTTTTKAVPDPVVGTELLTEVLSFSDVPVVAIGGIFPENVESVLSAGARNICMVRHLMCDQMGDRIAELQELL